jgi:hypothetical protein
MHKKRRPSPIDKSSQEFMWEMFKQDFSSKFNKPTLETVEDVERFKAFLDRWLPPKQNYQGNILN